MAGNFFARFARGARPKRVSVFDGQDLKRAMLAAQALLEQRREAINALNVFPVPDGDTGTNMTLTMRAAIHEIAALDDTSVSVIAEKLSRGAVMGARGNSGVILSQILRGVSNSLKEKQTFDAQELAVALQSAAKVAYSAVTKPVEGTILTVIRESAEAAQASAAEGSDIPALLGATVAAAKAAVAKTPELLPTLKQAGVVDAGGQGLATLLEGLWRYARGEAVQTDQAAEAAPLSAVDAHIHEEHLKGKVAVEEEFGYEVVFLLEGQNLNLDEIRDTILRMGGVSTVVAGDANLLKLHTHTLTPGKILDYGVSLGSLQDINIENLQAQSLRYAADSARQHGQREYAASANGASSLSGASGASAGTAVAPPPPVPAQSPAHPAHPAHPASSNATAEIGVVVVAAGEGWRQVFESLGAAGVVFGGQTMNPSTQELLAAVEACPCASVILLPNNGNVILSARQVPELASKPVYVVPSKTLPQGVGALLAFNFSADAAANAGAMEEALARVQTGEITRAVRGVELDGVRVNEGDIIGLVNDTLTTAGTEFDTVLRETLTRMGVADHEIVTLYYGAATSDALAQETAGRVKTWFPAQEVEVVNGGQPYYDYVISAE